MSRSWLVVFSLVTILFWYNQCLLTLERARQQKSIEQQYATSINGEVYVDNIFESDDIWLVTDYVTFTPGSWKDGWETRIFVKKMRSDYTPSKPIINVLPQFLKGKENTYIGNRLIPIGDDIWLVVKSKTHPEKLVVDREIDLFGILKKAYPPLEIKLDNPIKETDLWEAYVINERDFTIMNVTRNALRFIPAN